MKLKAIYLGISVLFASAFVVAKGPLDGKFSVYIKEVFYPLLIADGYCYDYASCDNGDFIRYTSWESGSCEIYGVTDDDLITKIVRSMKSSGINISSATFYKEKRQEVWFFTKPKAKYVEEIKNK